MANAPAPVVHIGENSPEKIAYLLMADVFGLQSEKGAAKTRKEVLDTYTECLEAVKGYRQIEKSGAAKMYD